MLKRRRLDDLHSDHYKGNLATYAIKPIDPYTDIESFMDVSLKHKNDHALKWRLNCLFLSRKCSCGEVFHRGHIRDCNLIDDHPLVATIKTSPRFVIQREELRRKANDPNHFNFCCLDYLINTQDFDAFESIVTHLKNKLSSG